MGNTEPGDGPRFKGRGLLQLTGRANYKDYGDALGVDLVANPTLAAQPALSLKIACEYWKRNNINPDCDRDDLLVVSRKINGAPPNALNDRRAYTMKAKAALARLEAVRLAGSPPAAEQSRPVLARGFEGDAVAQLQNFLRDLNFAVAVDGDFGPGTEVAVTRFQYEHGLTADGIAGPQTWAAINSAKQTG